MKNKEIITNTIQRRFYVIAFVGACFFATGNWFFLWRIYMTSQQIGFVDAICFVALFLCEIPSGALADLFGRKRMMIAGALLMGIGYTVQGIATNGHMILAGYFLYSVGSASYSGADDALMYDWLKGNGQESLWQKVVSRKYIATRSGALLATFIGGWLFLASPRLPSITRGVFFLLMIPVIFGLPEVIARRHHSSKLESFKVFGRQTRDGMRYLFRRELLGTAVLVLGFGGVVETMYIAGVLKPILLAHFGLGGFGQSIFIGSIGLATIAMLYMTSKRKHSSYAVLYASAIIMTVGFGMTLLGSVFLALIGLFAVQTASGLFSPASSDILNKNIPSSHRATALSTASMLESAPYILAATYIGRLGDEQHFALLSIGATAILLVSLGVGLLLNQKFSANKGL